MGHKILLFGFALFISIHAVQAAPPEIADVIKSQKPYGEGHMNFLFIKAYNARLWTDAPTWSMDAPFAMEITYGMAFDTDDLTERTIREMKNVDPAINDAAIARLTPELDKVYPPVKSGDRLVALYVPGKPVMFTHNGQPTGSIAGESFAKDFFGIWLSPDTSAPSLREKLLRLK
ncbi:MAG TPA: chalcone isomerase family protein [Rhizomicrobium sp.]|nr:chalcone isomerase family protein [Rhizomicrobium sp.]